MLLKIGIGLAMLAVVLLIVALVLRAKDKRAEAAYDYEDFYEYEPQKPVQEAARPAPPQMPRREVREASAAPVRQAPQRNSATVAPDAGTAAFADSGLRPVVRAMSGFFAGGVVPVGAKVAIGRDSASCQLVYPMDMTSISRCHVKVTYDMRSGMFAVTDMSTNGTFFENGKRLAKGKPTAMAVGDQFFLSDKDEMYKLDLEAA